MRLLLPVLAFLIASPLSAQYSKPAHDRTPVTVENQSFDELVIYVTRGGSSRTRIGEVHALSEKTFWLPETLLGIIGDLRLLVRISDGQWYVTESVSIPKHGGAELRIANQLQFSTFIPVRPR